MFCGKPSLHTADITNSCNSYVHIKYPEGIIHMQLMVRIIAEFTLRVICHKINVMTINIA